MSLGSGTRLGIYEVVSLLGRGGMGEVYRARDTKLARDVALKVLPNDLETDPDRLARFEREAKTLASLNHPHIAQIFGFEQSDGISALVMELVEGEDLSQRIARGAIPLGEAVPIARQIAAALEAAHEQSIIHRDLKPANVKVRPDGTVKVLDFGLAKALDHGASGPQEQIADSPTITTPAMTMRGVILGTAAYMAPEQAKGKPLDKRADVWAFGCVLYEMLTGRRAFDGEDITDVLGAVVRLEPDWSLVPGDVPMAIRSVLQGCLMKDRRRRVADMSTVLFVMEYAAHLAPTVSPNQAAAASSPNRDRRALWQYVALAGIGGLVVGGVLAGLAWQALRPAASRVVRFVIAPPDDQPFTSTPGGTNLAISPDGSVIVYQVQRAEIVQLYARGIDQLDARPLPGTEGAAVPVFSPDGAQIGFLAGGKIKRVGLAGGPVFTVSDYPDGRVNLSWTVQDFMIFDTDGANGGIFRVPSTGGQPERLADAQKNEGRYRAAELLPDGKTLLFSIQEASVDGAKIAVRSLETGEQRILFEGGTSARYVSTGHLVYGRTDALMAVPFDLSRLQVTGPAVAVLDSPGVKAGGAARFALAANGTLVYAPGNFGTSGPARFVWVTRDGRETKAAIAATIDNPRDPRISPDGQRLAATVGASAQGQIWVYDLTGARQPLKLTFKEINQRPIWTGAGKRILYSSVVNARERTLMSVAADASVLEPELLVANANSHVALSPDGRSILFGRDGGPGFGPDLWLLSTDADSTPRPWLQTSFRESEPSFSPDGRWLAYHSNPTGTGEIWVRPFPGPGAPIRVSDEGGHGAVWSRDGKELFYQDDGRMMAASVIANGDIRFTPPRMLFEGGFIPWQPFLDFTFDVAPDGRFLMMESVSGKTSPVAQHFVVVLNWFEELKARVPKAR